MTSVKKFSHLTNWQAKIVEFESKREGDVENPRGGVRHIIAGKGFYEDKK